MPGAATGGTARRGRVLLIIGGGIAAYKSLELIRLLRGRDLAVTPVLTAAGREFVTPLSVQTLAGEPVREELFSLTEDSAIGHIELSRSADLVVVCPATANLMARMRAGLADDLATTLLLATDTPVLLAPAMNVRMWQHPATRESLAVLRERGVAFVGPEEGDMACGEFGPGRLAEPPAILAAIEGMLFPERPLEGCHALVTAGPTHEPIDPVRVIANRSSGKQGFAIAAALARLGARVTLVSGPVSLATPPGVARVDVETAREMLDACLAALPAEIAVCVAAVADWRVESEAAGKIKKDADGPPVLRLVENPDILATLARPGPQRPRLVIGFAAETDHLLEHAAAKRVRKGADWLVANSVGAGSGVFGGDTNAVTLLTATGTDSWPALPKDEVAGRLAARIASALSGALS
ncbi:bifunctional phosphopantothenoylcysteine decarboxylase/phosphopantothenate--cysteine ligase CoaBC [Acidomonas methanolica]|uniref:Coenzyme A biosynthesis bifunctional protein CoaBC n=1 Tax=Acidomonas methanolica NBRC 104435 TaxID=1231351 RepID=A0A023D5I3_ACIMT|nr:bifunctional phosphopantothenoylcysteine decarboxylase/phosphopantothenate--cysteine ligase CoaBC [Acidomonas methanolica]MBU2653171.1 bifunctional phosphopantothenoylcysteine decarboxylase/phosphopantothenate--cysteine ligase CoaBC [Acidomonas methanolica]TCS32120.1 phosphopantothenate-cysteine ligase /phosphopantothenoylcysteine decarboxylase [Acidomonas methanolica]GAJ29402.1 phosphopantothenoylcysteine synthase [Acidomonas methanolica NBRC 104435]GBQ55972.1 phosphopantothenoylcysteine sy